MYFALLLAELQLLNNLFCNSTPHVLLAILSDSATGTSMYTELINTLLTKDCAARRAHFDDTFDEQEAHLALSFASHITVCLRIRICKQFNFLLNHLTKMFLF